MPVRRGPVIAVAGIALVALLVPILPLADPQHADAARQLASPSLLHPLGQDELGRDVLSRLLWGVRGSLAIAAGSASLACLLGTALGLIGVLLPGVTGSVAEYGGAIVRCFPPVLLALLVVTLAGPGAATRIPVLALLYAPGFARALHDDGPSARWRKNAVMRSVRFRIAPAMLAQFSVAVSSAVMLESGLSFAGLGVTPPALSLGQLIGAARATMDRAPLSLLWPSAVLVLTILAMDTLCDAWREAAGPRPLASRSLRHEEPLPPPRPRPPAGTAVLVVRDLTIEADTPAGLIQSPRGVSFAVNAGETVAIVEAGDAGRSLIGPALIGLLPEGARISEGSAWLQGHNLLRLDDRAFRRVRGGVLSMVSGDARFSLNPVHRIGTQIAEAMHAHYEVAHYEAKEEVETLLSRVGIADPRRCARAYPHQLPDDVRQRALIAMAIANDPRLLIADEPTATLDAAAAAQVLDLLVDLRRELRMGMVLISRSLPAVARIADRVLVLHAGEIVEQGPVQEVFAAPLHPYTAMAVQSARCGDADLLRGMTTPPVHEMPPGCAFAPHCRFRAAVCETQRPPLIEVAPGRETRCLRWRELACRSA
jgi:peptide/nickel transport system permease protein